MRMAPSKRITSPLIMGFSAIAVTRCANSAGSPRRDGKGTCLARKLCTFSGNPARSGVENRPEGKENEKKKKE